MNELINDKAVYRTAPATPGLLISDSPNLPLKGLLLKKSGIRVTSTLSAFADSSKNTITSGLFDTFLDFFFGTFSIQNKSCVTCQAKWPNEWQKVEGVDRWARGKAARKEGAESRSVRPTGGRARAWGFGGRSQWERTWWWRSRGGRAMESLIMFYFIYTTTVNFDLISQCGSITVPIKTKWMNENLSQVTCPMPRVKLDLSHVLCHMSIVTFHLSLTPTATDLPLLGPPLSTVHWF